MMVLQARNFQFTFPRPALVMGIVNVTPDSFSDGGNYFETRVAIEHGLELASEGADIIDVGGESSRPGAEPVSEAEELRRVLPVIAELARRITQPISIDTTKAVVAQAALDAGASIVNDIAANRSDETLWRLVAESGAAYVCMHMQGGPRTMQADPHYENVTMEVRTFFFERIKRLNDCGVAAKQLILDPGIGFGKTPQHNLELIANLGTFVDCGRPIMLGVSRKSFIGKLLGNESETRLWGSIACACAGVRAGAAIIRTHDVRQTVAAVRMTEAILAKRRQAGIL
jgi:dihydropteroate synthase